MAYVKAVVAAIAAGLLVGAGGGFYRALTGALSLLRPEDRATVLAPAVTEAMNAAAFYVLVFVPVAFLAVMARRRWPRRPAADESL
jgi:hypothetical protein